MISLNEFKSGGEGAGIGGVFSKLFEARNFAHMAHLRTKSYAQHKALGHFYEEIVELADSLYETYAGQYGQIKFNAGPPVKEEDTVRYMESFGKMMLEAHKLIDEKDTHLHNILDEIIALAYQTNYKLKFLS